MSSPFIDSGGLNSCAFNMIPSQVGSPTYAFTGLPNPQIGQFNQPQSLFYSLPLFRQAFAPGRNYSALKDKQPSNNGNSDSNAEKKFLVFDQSGDQTTVMVSSGPGSPFRCLTSWTLNQPMQPNMDDQVYGVKTEFHPISAPISENELDDNTEEADFASEMREDTEELNALLYSDDEDCESYFSDEHDDVTSTGHSPSSMTAQEKPDQLLGEDKEEVASSSWPRKRKWSKTVADTLDDAASSDNVNLLSNCLSNTGVEWESSGFCKMGLSSGSKRMQKERILETVGLLQEMIPGLKGKDAVVVLDEAIDYLKSLKAKAKAMGLPAP